MPIYEYACRECNDQFEILQKLGEGADHLACPSCGAHELQKQFSTFAGVTGGNGGLAAGAAATDSCGAPACGTGFT